MAASVNPRRRYDATSRQAAARDRRRVILDVARELFLTQGYADTSVTALARAAGVAVDTVYSLGGSKPQIFRILLEAAISGTGEEVPVLDRPYVQRMRLEPDAGRKLAIYVEEIAQMQARLGPLYRVLREAQRDDPSLGQVWHELQLRRARNMPLLVEELARTGALRSDLDIQDAATDIWSLNSTEVYCLFIEHRSWTVSRYEVWLRSRLERLLFD